MQYHWHPDALDLTVDSLLHAAPKYVYIVNIEFKHN